VQDQQRGRILVAGQFLLIGLVALAPGPEIWIRSFWSLTSAFLFAGVGIALLIPAFRHLGSALRANPVPKPEAPLQTMGLYAKMRHPIYTGVLSLSLGISIFRATALSFFFLLLLVVLLNAKARWEENMLKSKHQGYSSYMAKVPRFLPRLGKNRNLNDQ